jgi:hypothetical protein
MRHRLSVVHSKRITARVKDIANEFRIIPLMTETLRQEYEQVLIMNCCEGYHKNSSSVYCHLDNDEVYDIETQKNIEEL